MRKTILTPAIFLTDDLHLDYVRPFHFDERSIPFCDIKDIGIDALNYTKYFAERMIRVSA